MDVQNKKINKKVLIIEDEKPMAKAMELKLQMAGIDAHAVFNGEDGLTELDTNQYDLVLLDLIMPILDGWSVLERLRQKKNTVKVVITSNLSQDEDIEKAKELGAINFLIKSNETLSDIVEEVKKLLI